MLRKTMSALSVALTVVLLTVVAPVAASAAEATPTTSPGPAGGGASIFLSILSILAFVVVGVSVILFLLQARREKSDVPQP